MKKRRLKEHKAQHRLALRLERADTLLAFGRDLCEEARRREMSVDELLDYYEKQGQENLAESGSA